jgi:DNA-directed RNA polymerase specialized sigma24 family protein
MTTNRTLSAHRGHQEAIPSDPSALYALTRRILYLVAGKVRRAVRLKLEGHGHDEAEADELVNDSFLALLEALPRWDAGKGKLSTFCYGLARRRMWLLARATFYGVTPEQMHRIDTRKASPRYHYSIHHRRGFRQPVEDAEGRKSVRKVEVIRRTLPRADRRLIDLYLQERGCYSAVARRLHRCSTFAQKHLHRVFDRVREQFPCGV